MPRNSGCERMRKPRSPTPDEIMQFPPDTQLLRVQGKPTVIARKLRYYADPEFRDLFVPQDP